MTEHIRLRVLAELKRQAKTTKWLAEQLNVQPSAVGMWKSRGVPRAQYMAIAQALGQSVAWLMGQADREAERPLSPAALRIGREFDRITDPSKQLDALARCLTAIGKAIDDEPA